MENHNDTLLNIADRLLHLMADYDPYEYTDYKDSEGAEDIANELCDESSRNTIIERLHEMHSEWCDDADDTAHIAARTDSLIAEINNFFSE